MASQVKICDVTLRDGTRIERDRRGTRVTYRDGWTETLREGRYEIRDRNDRRVVERAATREDRARIEELIGR